MSLYRNVNAYQQISSFYPRWYLDIYDMNEILKIEALVAENAQKAIDLILDNHFLDTINADKATELERYLGITTSADRPIDERRLVIKSYFLGRGKLSLAQIIAIVQALSGGKVTGTFSKRNNNGDNGIRLNIYNCDIKGMLIDIIATLKDRVPAHLWVSILYEPAEINMGLTHKHGTYGVGYNSVGSPGIREDDCTSISKIGCAQYHFLSDVLSFNTALLYGGRYNTNYNDAVNGGSYTVSSDDYINGNY